MGSHEDFERDVPDEALAELLAHFDDADVRFENTRVRRHPLGCDVLTDVAWWETDSDGPGYDIRHTVVLLHRPLTTLPEFEIRPRQGLGEKMLGVLVSALGMPALELESEPAFTDRYSVMTANPESVRTLLGREAIDSILAVEDLFLKFSGRGVVLSRHDLGSSSGGRSPWTAKAVRDHRLDVDASARLLEDAAIAGGPIVDDPEVGRRAADAVEGTYAEEALKAVEDRGGLIGRKLARITITEEMLEQLRLAPTPRTDIPAPIARRAWGGTSMPLLIAPVFGLAFSGVGVVSMLGGSMEGLAFLGVGVVAAIASILVLRHRAIRKRLVIRGTPAQGRIISVERTDTSVNDDPQHRISVETTDGLEPVVVTMGSAPARQARRLMEAGGSTWVLRDPRKPNRALWLEGWSLASALD